MFGLINRLNKAEKRIVDLYKRIGKIIVPGDGGDGGDTQGLPYDSYVARLFFLGTDIEISEVYENTIDPGINIFRNEVGIYTINSPLGAFGKPSGPGPGGNRRFILIQQTGLSWGTTPVKKVIHTSNNMNQFVFIFDDGNENLVDAGAGVNEYVELLVEIRSYKLNP